MIELTPLTQDTAADAFDVYGVWVDRVSYYFQVDAQTFAAALFKPPQVHPATFDHCVDASMIAREARQPVGWIQAGHVSGTADVPDGARDALIRAVVVRPGRADVADALVRHAVTALSNTPVHVWRAFEHLCGYAFAAGMGRGPQRMTEVVQALRAVGFQTEYDNHVYALRSLKRRPPRVEHRAIETQILPGGWSEIGGFVRWDRFHFFQQGENVGYATVVPVARLIDDPNENTLFMKGIAVAPQHRRRGIGYLIMRTVWDHYRDQGIDCLLLNTGDENVVAQRFYRSIGFELTDIITSYIADGLTL